MRVRMDGDCSPIIVGTTTTPLAVAIGEQIEGLFRFGCSYAKLAKDVSRPRRGLQLLTSSPSAPNSRRRRGKIQQPVKHLAVVSFSNAGKVLNLGAHGGTPPNDGKRRMAVGYSATL